MSKVIILDTNRSYYGINEASENSITVEELISELQNYPSDAKIVFRNDNGYTYGYITSESLDEETVVNETEEEEDVITREGMITELEEGIKKNGGRPLKVGCVWLDKFDEEVITVGIQDGGTLGVGTDQENFYPMSELSDDDVAKVWYEPLYM
jgi:hypothetical protein